MVKRQSYVRYAVHFTGKKLKEYHAVYVMSIK